MLCLAFIAQNIKINISFASVKKKTVQKPFEQLASRKSQEAQKRKKIAVYNQTVIHPSVFVFSRLIICHFEIYRLVAFYSLGVFLSQSVKTALQNCDIEPHINLTKKKN